MREAEVCRAESSRARTTDYGSPRVARDVVVGANPRCELFRHEVAECDVCNEIEQTAAGQVVHHNYNDRFNTARGDQIVPRVVATPVGIEILIAVEQYNEDVWFYVQH